MSEDFAISVRDVVKQYKIRHKKGRTLKEAFLRQGVYSETNNALNHVSFDVEHGSTIGLIGSNGSGKSTMLKLIAGTSKPNSGEVVVSGRVSALLELGAGFHPDFTGRENVYLDGIILGLTRREIDKRFDEIVQFAEMEEFIDAPTKTYSSGMYMRLAFSVAVMVDPDILLIDEVLAVGDESFQRKCMARINEFKSQGKTIFFVSHSMDSVRNLCDRAVWLDKGNLSSMGDTSDVIADYLRSVNQHDKERSIVEGQNEEGKKRWGTRRAEITEVKLTDNQGKEKNVFEHGESMKVHLTFNSRSLVESPVIGLMIRRKDGTICYGTNTLTVGEAPDHLPDSGKLVLEVDQLTLLPGYYNITAILRNFDCTETFDQHESKYGFEILGELPYEIGTSQLPCRWLHWPEGA